MWGAYRWAARFLLLIVLVPSFGPLTMACVAQPQRTHCLVRKAAAPQAQQRAMQCPHGIAQSASHASDSSAAEPGSPFEAVLKAGHNGDCCRNHCCCGATTSEWAQPTSHSLLFLNFVFGRAHSVPTSFLHSSDISGVDSARAPPRS